MKVPLLVLYMPGCLGEGVVLGFRLTEKGLCCGSDQGDHSCLPRDILAFAFGFKQTSVHPFHPVLAMRACSAVCQLCAFCFDLSFKCCCSGARHAMVQVISVLTRLTTRCWTKATLRLPSKFWQLMPRQHTCRLSPTCPSASPDRAEAAANLAC